MLKAGDAAFFEVAEETRVGAAGEAAFVDTGFGAAWEEGVALVEARVAGDADDVFGDWWGGAAVEDEEAEGEGAEVDAHDFAEHHPVAVLEDFRGRGGVEVAPVAFVGFGEHAAGRAVGAGGDDVEVGAELIAEGDETAAGVAGAGFDDDGGLGVAEDVEEVGFADGVEFSEDVTDEDHAWGGIAGAANGDAGVFACEGGFGEAEGADGAVLEGDA